MRSPLAALLALLTACDPAAQGATQVKMHDNAFNAPVVRIPAGAGVTFTNNGRNPHNIVPVDPARWPSALDTGAVAPGGKQQLTLAAAGVYEYYCSYHGTRDGRGMAGAIVVGDVPYAGGATGRIPAVAEPSGVTRHVPRQYPTIQGAVDAAQPGDLVLVDTGTYKEEVTVTTPSLVIRGVDRNAVVLDGEFLRPNGVNVLADAVAVENLTVRHHTFNGVFWNGVTGYRGRYLTAYNNGDYGIYAFDSKDGLIEDSYASGSPDAGFYIGQCDPCRAVIRRVVAEHNTLGYSGTNSSGDLHILSSTWRYNRGGLVPNSLDTELYPPQHHTVIRGNLIHDNNSRTAPGKGLGPIAWGHGILIGGGDDNVVEENVVVGHATHGVLVAPIIDAHWWPSRGNLVSRNLVMNSGRADIALAGPTSVGNCVARNGDARLAPRLAACRPRGRRAGAGDDATAAAVRARDGAPPHGTRERLAMENDLAGSITLALRMLLLRGDSFPDWRTQPVPPPQPSMPDARTAPALPAFAVFEGLRGELDHAPLPPEADSVLRAANERRGAPAESPRVGLALRGLQAAFPMTGALLIAWAVLLLALRVRLWWVTRLGRAVTGTRLAWRLATLGGAAWVLLNLATAASFAAM